MNYLATIIISVALIFAPLSATTASNLGFESGALSPWVAVRNASTGYVTTFTPRTGTYSLRLDNSTVCQTITAVNASYTFSLWVRSASTNVPVDMWIGTSAGSVYGSAANYITADGTYKQYSAVTTGYTFVYGQDVSFCVQSSSSGIVALVDDVSIVYGAALTAPTPTNTPTNTPLPTNTPTNTPVVTSTPTNTAVATQVLVTATPVPPTATPTTTNPPAGRYDTFIPFFGTVITGLLIFNLFVRR